MTHVDMHHATARRTRVALLTFSALFAIVSCDENLPNGPDRFPAQLKIVVPRDTIVIGDSNPAQAQAIDANGHLVTGLTFKWTVTNNQVVALGAPPTSDADAVAGRTNSLISVRAGQATVTLELSDSRFTAASVTRTQTVVVAGEQYNNLLRLIQNHVPTTVRVNVQGRYFTQDTSGYIIFLFVLGAACASTVAIGFVVATIKGLEFWPKAWHLALTIAALLSSWLVIQTVFGFHYARRYYRDEQRQPPRSGGLAFPGGAEPDYMDFAYYSFVVGMTSQVSDVQVISPVMRRMTLVHGVLAFIFNIAVLALSINTIASALL